MVHLYVVFDARQMGFWQNHPVQERPRKAWPKETAPCEIRPILGIRAMSRMEIGFLMGTALCPINNPNTGSMRSTRRRREGFAVLRLVSGKVRREPTKTLVEGQVRTTNLVSMISNILVQYSCYSYSIIYL